MYLVTCCQETSEKVGASAINASVAVKQEESVTMGSKMIMERNEAKVSMARKCLNIWRVLSDENEVRFFDQNGAGLMEQSIYFDPKRGYSGCS